MDFKATLAYLYDQLPMYQRVGKTAFKKDLTNTIKLCDLLGNPQNNFKSVHIAGTNGKGSSAHMLASVLQAAGYKTGLYTSPHLKSFTERIRINGAKIEEDFVCEFVERLEPSMEEIRPSFFEITVVMAFEYFARHQVDIAIIEVGLGGRFDSTNVILPLISLITSIGLDHTDMLGDTLQLIAFEKAGIIKENVPVVISESQADIMEVFRKKAEEMNAPIYFADGAYSVTVNRKDPLSPTFDVKYKHKIHTYVSDLVGEYQTRNLPGVFQVIELLNRVGFSIHDKDIRQGLASVMAGTGLKGRWQKLNDQPLMICDTVHNEAGLSQLLRQISAVNFQKLFIIWGAVEGKDPHGIFGKLPEQAFYYFCEPKITRAFPAQKLYEIAVEHNRKGVVILDVNEAIDAAMKQAGPNDFIFIGGSNFVVAEIDNL